MTINGNISGGGLSTYLYVSTENNFGTVTLNGTNSIAKILVVQTGQLNVSRVNNIGVAGTLGSGTTLVFGNGGASTPNLWYTGTSANSTNRTIQLNSGTTRIISQDAKLTLAGNISPTGATPVLQLSGDGGGNFNEVSGVISGNIAVQVVSHQPVGGTAEAGAWILSGNNTYTGATTISAGTLEIGAAGRLGSGSYAGNIANSGTFIYSGANDQTLSGIISGTGALTQNAASTLTLSNTNTYNGTTTVNAGTIALGANQNIGAISGAGALNLSTYTLTTNASSDTTFSGVISSTGSLTKNGTGTLTLSNTNTYNGSTTINAGTLAVSGNIANSGLVINSGGIISPGTSGAVDTFGTSSITINGGGYNWTLSSANGSAGTGYDQITSTGALTSSGLLTVYAYGTPGDWDGAATYDWDIFNANSVSGFSAGNFALDVSNFGIAAGNRTGIFSFSNPSGGIIRLTYTASSGPVWVGGTGNWSTGFTTAPTQNATITFTGVGGTATNNISTGTLTTVGDIEFRSGAGAYTLAANAGSAGASGGTALTVNGSIINDSTATQTLNTDLAFAATRTIAANTGNISIGGAISGAGGLTKNGSMQRSYSEFRQAVDIVRNGWIGEITEIHTNLRSDFPPLSLLPEEPIPADIDYDRWLGPAPWRPYNNMRVLGAYGNGWRVFWDYGSRKNGDWGAHHFDIVQWALDMDGNGPVLFVPKGFEGEPYQYHQYANGLKVTASLSGGPSNGAMIRFVGKNGEVKVSRDSIETTPAGLASKIPSSNEFRAYRSNDHRQNWLDSIISRRPPICPATVGASTFDICSLAGIAERLNRPIRWNPEKREITGDPEASRFADYTRRAGYPLPL